MRDDNEMTKFFLIGGAGFIGSQMTRELLEAGDEVIIYDAFINFLSSFETHYPTYLVERYLSARLLQDMSKIRLVSQFEPTAGQQLFGRIKDEWRTGVNHGSDELVEDVLKYMREVRDDDKQLKEFYDL